MATSQLSTKQRLTVDPELRSYMRTLTDDERAQLRANLAEFGRAHDPLIAWGDVLLDGHNRYELCTELGLPFDVVQAAGVETREDAKRWIVDHQLGRRNLTPKEQSYYRGERYRLEKREVGDNQHTSLPQSEAPARTSERLASELGVSRATVERDAQFADAVDKLTEQLGHDVRQKVIANDVAISRKDIVKLAAVVAPAEQKAKVLAAASNGAKQAAKAVKKLEAVVRKETREAAKIEAVAEAHPLDGESYRVRCMDVVTAAKESLRMQDGDATGLRLVDAIVTDPPYPVDYLHLFGWLGTLAANVVKPGGSVLVMSGQSWLLDVMDELSAGREWAVDKYKDDADPKGRRSSECESGILYRWTLCYYTPGQSCQVFGRHVKSNWKPVLWYSAGESKWEEHVDDVVRSDGNDKRFHEWGQDVGGMAALIERFTDKGDLILDPFCGAGTTGVAALRLGRLFEGWDVDESRVAQSAKRLAEASR